MYNVVDWILLTNHIQGMIAIPYNMFACCSIELKTKNHSAVELLNLIKKKKKKEGVDYTSIIQITGLYECVSSNILPFLQ